MRELKARGGMLAILAAAAALYAVFIARSAFRVAGILYFTLLDDAMISMRYAQHLAGGLGLVWNPGQPPVEGFTNPAWMLLMAGFHLLPIPASKISLGIMVVSAICLLAGIAIVFQIARTLRPALNVTPLLAAGMAAFYFPLVFWSLRGMEVGLLALLIDGALLVLLRGQSGEIRHAILLGLLLSLAVLTRLDALLQVAVMIAYLVLTKAQTRAILIPLAMSILTAAAIMALQRAYFGDFLPNTYYQKMAGTTIPERVTRGLLAFYLHAAWDTVLPVAVSLAAFIFYRDFRRAGNYLLAAVFLVQSFYSVWVGGDYAGEEVRAANRFITEGMPALIILFSMALDRLLSDARVRWPGQARGRAFAATGLTVVALAVMSGGPWLAWLRNNAPMFLSDMRRTRQGVLLAKYTRPQAVIAVHAAGQIPYYSGRTTIDLLGLNDPVIARGPLAGPFYPGHDKWNYNYSIGQLQPDVIADNWIMLPAYMKTRSDYVRLENGFYVRRDTRLVDARGLESAAR